MKVTTVGIDLAKSVFQVNCGNLAVCLDDAPYRREIKKQGAARRPALVVCAITSAAQRCADTACAS
jgi:hypothetical protein